MIAKSYIFRKGAFLLTLAGTITFASCPKDDDDAKITPSQPTYEVPATYNFQNVNFGGQTNRIDMLTALTEYIGSGNLLGVDLEKQKMLNMYANSNNPFTNTEKIKNAAELNASGKQLKDKTYTLHQSVFETYFDSISVASKKNRSAENGKAGVLKSTTDNTKSWLVNANGIEYGQLVAKHMMGAVFYYQAMEGYLTDAKIGNTIDNTTVKTGEGTVMEHHFDEAFGYFGAPADLDSKDFEANKTRLKYWANYSNQVNKAYTSNKNMMDGFLKGRAAISNKDMAGKAAAVTAIRNEWEKLVAASAILEMKAAKPFIGANRDQAKVSHYLSEAMGFIYALQYKSDRKMNDDKMKSVLAKLGTNLYETKGENVDAAIDELSTLYAMDDIKAKL